MCNLTKFAQSRKAKKFVASLQYSAFVSGRGSSACSKYDARSGKLSFESENKKRVPKSSFYLSLVARKSYCLIDLHTGVIESNNMNTKPNQTLRDSSAIERKLTHSVKSKSISAG